MNITKIEEGLYRITPDEGKHLTQVILEENEERVFCMSAFVIEEADTDRWIEWTDEQKVVFENENNKDNGHEAD